MYICTSTFSSIQLSFIDQYFIFPIAIKLHENDRIFIVIFTLRGEANEYGEAKRATWVSDFYWIYVTLDQRSTGIYSAESRGTPRNPKFLKIFLTIP